MEKNSKYFDVLIIGSGGAGCAAAIEANKVTKNLMVVTKTKSNISKTANAQGGIQAAISEGDSPAIHYQDTIKAGNNKGKPALVKILSESAGETIQWLEKIGVKFDRNEQGYKLKNAAGLSHPRVLSCGDETGNRIIVPLINYVKRLGISIRENISVLKITPVKGGFELTTRAGQDEETLYAKSVIIATGGLLPREKRAGLSLGNIQDVPDGVGLVEELGGKVVNPELMQYHPTGIISPIELRRMRLPETMRGAGARFLDKNLEPFIDPLITRNKLSAGIVKACEEGRGVVTSDNYKGVWLTTPDIDRINGEGYTKANFTKFYNAFKEHGHDLTKENVLVYPIVHYSLGGIEIDQDAMTSIPGIFAAGETTYGIHGEDRLMGNSLLDIFVFGRIAGKSASKYAINGR